MFFHTTKKSHINSVMIRSFSFVKTLAVYVYVNIKNIFTIPVGILRIPSNGNNDQDSGNYELLVYKAVDGII